jgi:uncharacterized protein (TIGR02996 family)
MTDEAAFLKAICDNPNDMAPRLIYVDWLEEQGKNQLAEWIRKRIGSDTAIECTSNKPKDTIFYHRNGFYELVYTSPLEWAKMADQWTGEHPINQVVFSERPNLWWECFANLVNGHSSGLVESLEIHLYLEADPRVSNRQGKRWRTQVPCQAEMDVNWASEKWSRKKAKELASSLDPYRALWPKVSFHLYESVLIGGRPQYFLDPPSNLQLGDLLNTHHQRSTQELLRRRANPWDIAEQGGDRSPITWQDYRTDDNFTFDTDTNSS